MRAGWKEAMLDRVLLTGGSSGLWSLQRRMGERFGAKVRLLGEGLGEALGASTVVAVGAALFAQRSAEAEQFVVRGALQDAYGLKVYRRAAEAGQRGEAVLQTLLPAGTSTPFEARKSFVLRGETAKLSVELFEGSTLTDATPAGRWEFEFTDEVTEGSKVELTLRVEADGVLELGVAEAGGNGFRPARRADAEGLYSPRK